MKKILVQIIIICVVVCGFSFSMASEARFLPCITVLSYGIDMFDTCTIDDLEELAIRSGYSQEKIDKASKNKVYHRIWLQVDIEHAWWDTLAYNSIIIHNSDSIDFLITMKSFITEKENDSHITGYIWGWINTESDVQQIIQTSQLNFAVYDKNTDNCLDSIPVDVSKVIEEKIPEEGFSIILERAKVYPVNFFDLTNDKFSLVFRELDIVFSSIEWKDILEHPDDYYVCIFQGIKRKTMPNNVYNVLFGTPLKTDNVWISKSNRYSYGYLGIADNSHCDDMIEDGNKYVEVRLFVHAKDTQSAKHIITETPICAYFATMCYDDSEIQIAGPIQHKISIDKSNIPIYFLK